VLLTATMAAGASPPALASPLVLHVDGNAVSCSDTYDRPTAGDPATPWCSLAPASRLPEPGDSVLIEPATYAGTFTPVVSGTPAQPITYEPSGPGVVLDGNGATATVKLVSVGDVELRGIEIRGGALQGVWVAGATRITLSGLIVRANPGHGVQIKDSTDVTVTGSHIESNGMAGIFEATGTTNGRYTDNVVTGNGIDGQPFNGDGIQLSGSGAFIAGNTITGNGDPGPYEHGIYAGPVASGYVIERNDVSGNAGSNVKAAGSGTVRYNDIHDGRLGVVIVDNTGSGVAVYYNLIHGRYQHPVFLTTGSTGAARAQFWNNTIVSDGRSTASGDASAVFVNASASVDLRNNVICYRGTDGAGVAIDVPDPTRALGFKSDFNWWCSADAYQRHFVRGTSRLTLKQWRRTSAQDAHSFGSRPLAFSPDLRLPQDKWSTALGTPLGLTRDYLGAPVPAGRPTMGAYQQ
jgi:hypothetical protein